MSSGARALDPGGGRAALFPMRVRAFDAAEFGTYETRDEATIRAFCDRASQQLPLHDR